MSLFFLQDAWRARQVPILPQNLRQQTVAEAAHVEPHWSQTLQVRRLRQVVRQDRLPAQT